MFLTSRFYKCVFFLPLCLFITCCNSEHVDQDRKLNDTIYTKNGFTLILEEGSLRKITKAENKDSINILFGDQDFRIDFKNKKGLRKYFFDKILSLYKLKYSIVFDSTKIRQNQIIYIDTLSDNFLVNSESEYISMSKVPDTIKINERSIVHINLMDSIFPKLELFVLSPEANLTFKKEFITKRKGFLWAKGVTDTIVFSKPGVFYYQGYIQNYFVEENKHRTALIQFFKRKIVVVN